MNVQNIENVQCRARRSKLNEAGWSCSSLVVMIFHILTNQFVVCQLPPAMKDCLLKEFTMNVPKRKEKINYCAGGK